MAILNSTLINGDLKVTGTSYAITHTNTSDKRLKENIKPIKEYSSVSRGIWLKKVVTAQAPGNDVILISLFLNSRRRTLPGSEIKGVPASDTNAMFLPSSSKEIILLLLSISLNLWQSNNFALNPYFSAKFLLTLVSSHAI